jgi:hypothetical protein
MKLDPAVKKESAFIAAASLAGTVLVQLVFAMLGKWDLSVLLGGAIGWIMAAGNFFLMSLTVQRAVGAGDSVRAGQTFRLSYTVRTLAMLGVIALSLLVDAIHWIPVVAAVFFPRVAILIRQWIESGKEKPDTEEIKDGAAPSPAPAEEEEETEDEFEKFVGSFAKKIDTNYSGTPSGGSADGDPPSDPDSKGE